MIVVDIFETIVSYADIGAEEPDPKPLLPMETCYVAVLLVIFYYKLFVTIGMGLFRWIYTSELQKQLTNALTMDEDDYVEKPPINPQRSRKSMKKTN